MLLFPTSGRVDILKCILERMKFLCGSRYEWDKTTLVFLLLSFLKETWNLSSTKQHHITIISICISYVCKQGIAGWCTIKDTLNHCSNGWAIFFPKGHRNENKILQSRGTHSSAITFIFILKCDKGSCTSHFPWRWFQMIWQQLGF